MKELAEEFTGGLTEDYQGRCSDDIELDFHKAILEAANNSVLLGMHHVISLYFAKAARLFATEEIAEFKEQGVIS